MISQAVDIYFVYRHESKCMYLYVNVVVGHNLGTTRAQQ